MKRLDSIDKTWMNLQGVVNIFKFLSFKFMR